MQSVIIISLVLVLVIVLGLYALVFNYAFVRGQKPPGLGKKKVPIIWEQSAEKIDAGKEWFLSMKPERITIESFDKLELAADYVENPHSDMLMIFFHGYRADRYRDFALVLEEVYSMGMSLLMVHQRSHGDSEGRLITFGVMERLDCLRWSYHMTERLGEDVSICLYGMSMGASTVLMSSALELPPTVKAIVADCGFTSAYDIISHVSKRYLHLPGGPMAAMVNFFLKRHMGFSLEDANTIEAMEINERPILFFHGGDDEFVPVGMTAENYQACTGPKRFLLVPGAIHAASVAVDTQGYLDAMRGFLLG